ncbi:MAG TPA: hypothetical protein VGL95_07395 [Acetobacteraceae bacterium]|jgi:hypothetical protein
MGDQQPRPGNNDPKNESGRTSRSGTSAGISVANESSSGGADPIPPGGDAAQPRKDQTRKDQPRDKAKE